MYRYGTSCLHGGNDKHNTYGKCRPSAQQKAMRDDLQSKSIEELRKIALEKAPNGCATEYAIEAQKMIYKKEHWGY